MSEPDVTRIEPARTHGPDATAAYPPKDSAAELVRVLDQYLADLEAGRAPSREKLLADHPELVSQLEPCLSGMEFIHRAARPAMDTPARLGDFEIVGEVGRGGMGVVYEARQLSLKRKVALKVLRFAGVADKDAMERFQREAETVAQLHHTNIVPIFAIGEQKGVYYYAMQFIEGRSLAAVLERSQEDAAPLDFVEVARWMLQAAEALAHAHQRNVIHRDVKPSNLILDPAGQVWLTDFGLAKRIDDVTLSMTGALLGTPRYMSPEQASAAQAARRSAHATSTAWAPRFTNWPRANRCSRPTRRTPSSRKSSRPNLACPERSRRSAARPGDNHPQVPGQRGRGAVSNGPGVGRRLAGVYRRPGDQGPAGRNRRADCPLGAEAERRARRWPRSRPRPRWRSRLGRTLLLAPGPPRGWRGSPWQRQMTSISK